MAKNEKKAIICFVLMIVAGMASVIFALIAAKIIPLSLTTDQTIGCIYASYCITMLSMGGVFHYLTPR